MELTQYNEPPSNKDADPALGFLTRKETEVKLPRPTRVKNKTPAPLQITAEQILREARERQEAEIRPPKQKITDAEELAEYRLRKRKEYEDLIRRVRWNTSVWVKYAQWEESQKDFPRARSIWERALEVDYTNATLWLKYTEMEMKNKFVNHARNVWDRAVSLLPRIDQLWYKYIHMEEMLGNIAGARQVFERWMTWEPDHHGWAAYIKFELRYGEIERARSIYDRYVECHPGDKAWIRYAKFEVKNGDISRARQCYERAMEQLGEDGQTEELFVAFAQFEERCKEPERARVIYKYALDHIPKGKAETLYQKFVQFEKQYGDREGIENVVVGKKRFQYEEEVKKNPLNYDSWFDYARLEESVGDKEKVREVYERAIANIPPAEQKRYWQRYIYLWINYALYEELEAEDYDRTRDVFKACLSIIPHSKFTFSKIWIMAAQFEIRQKDLKAARTILGNAIGRAPKDKGYIEFEISEGEHDRTRQLYERLLDRTKHLKVWVSYAKFEAAVQLEEEARADEEGREPDMAKAAEQAEERARRTRSVFERAYDSLRTIAPEQKEERAMLLEEWKETERNFGEFGDVAAVQKKLPRKVKRKRPVTSEDGTAAGFEEYTDFIFPEETGMAPNLKILDAAYKWKRQKVDSDDEA
uniref:Uncharacterized protein n=1 Tax=Physcomitrium patens TaxID=3218 RepID=A0A7I4AFQ1_PHYPA